MKKKLNWIYTLLVVVLFLLFAIGSGSDTPKSETGITSLDLLRNDTVDLDVGEKDWSYFVVKGNDEFSLNDIDFISTSPEVATFEYDSTALTTYVYYNIKAVAPGETKVYVQTNDGKIKSEEITVRVSDETTIEETTSPETYEIPTWSEAEDRTPISTDFIKFDNAWDSKTDLQKDAFWNENQFKYVQWTGEIVEVQKKSVSVIVRNDTLAMDFIAYIVKEQRDDLINLNIGDKITINGELTVKKGIIACWGIDNAEIV